MARSHNRRAARPAGSPSRPGLTRCLWERREATRRRDDDLVFTGRLGARVNAKNLAARMLRPACRAARVGDWPTWHTFRRTAATMRFRNDWNAAQVSRYLGHADAGFTLRTYVHLLDDDQPEPDVLESVEQAEVRSALGAVRDAQSFDLDEAFVGRVSERLHHGGPILRTLDTPGVGIDGVELGAAVRADDRLAFIDDSIVGAGAT